MPEGQRRVHNRLAVLRAERGLSRKQLADKLGIDYQTIGYIDRGDYNPSLELALTIAGFFRLPVEAIFSLSPMTPAIGRSLRRAAGGGRLAASDGPRSRPAGPRLTATAVRRRSAIDCARLPMRPSHVAGAPGPRSACSPRSPAEGSRAAPRPPIRH